MLKNNRKVDASLVGWLRQNNPEMTLQEIAVLFGASRERIRQILVKQGLPTIGIIPKNKCLLCNKEIEKGSRFCRKCYSKVHTLTAYCDNCGKPITRKRSYILAKNKKHHFCDKKCQGQYAGRNYGFRVNKCNISHFGKLVKSSKKRTNFGMKSLIRSVKNLIIDVNGVVDMVFELGIMPLCFWLDIILETAHKVGAMIKRIAMSAIGSRVISK